MLSKKVETVLPFAIAVVAVIALGSWLGGVYGRHRALERRAANVSAQTRTLHESVRGIEVRSPLPAVLLWSVDGERSFEIHQRLPQGGVVLLVSPSCDICVGSAQELQQAIASVKSSPINAILLADQMLGSADFERTLKARNIGLPVYSDLQEVFRREYRVTANPAYFIINEDGVVTHLGAGVPGVSQLAEVFAIK